MACSFHQIPVHPDDRDKLSFITRHGQFRYKVMPMGAVDSSNVFCRLMELLLRGLTWPACLAFVDDVIVLGRDYQEHLNNLK
jgi:hypothetical protein